MYLYSVVYFQWTCQYSKYIVSCGDDGDDNAAADDGGGGGDEDNKDDDYADNADVGDDDDKPDLRYGFSFLRRLG